MQRNYFSLLILRNIGNKMHRFNLFLVISFLACSLLITSCKYDEGPFMSFRSKQARVVNSWAYNLVLHNGLDVTAGSSELSIDYTQSSIGFNDDGRFSTIISNIDMDSTVISTQYNGSWTFLDKKKEIELIYDSPFPPTGEKKTLFITQLRERVFWLEEVQGNNLVEYRLKPTP